MGWQSAALVRVCFCSALCARASSGPSPVSFPLLAYEVNLRLAPEKRWIPVLQDFIRKRGTTAFKDFYLAVLENLNTDAKEALAYYREHIRDFMAAFAANLPDAYGEMMSLADVLSAYAETPAEQHLFSRESVFLAQQHMEIASIAVSHNSSVVAGAPRNGECTSVVVRRPNQPLIHFRNWDFGPAPRALGTASVQVDFRDDSGGYRCLMALTHITKLTTCMRPGAFSLSLNARTYGFGQERGRAPAEQLRLLQEGHLPREAVLQKVMSCRSYQEAVKAAASAHAMTSLYAILSDGQGDGEGVVVTIMGNGSKADMWSMPDPRSEDGWFLVQTNADHWLTMSEQYYSTHRREHVKAKLRRLGPRASTTDLFEVLQDSSVYPEGNIGSDDGRIFRPSTVASVLMMPTDPTLTGMPWKALVWQALPEGSVAPQLV